MLSRKRAGVPTGARGRLGGFLPRRTQTRPDRAAAARWEVPPGRARTSRQKRNVPPWRNSFPKTRTQRGIERCRQPKKRRVRASGDRSRVGKRDRKNVRRDLVGARPGRDAVECDDACGAGRLHRSIELAELNAGSQSAVASEADVAGRRGAAGARYDFTAMSVSLWHGFTVELARVGAMRCAYRLNGRSFTVNSAGAPP